MTNLTKMLCLVDGEHYLPVTQEAIDTFELQPDKIDLILLDVMMPKLDGWSVLRQIRQESQVPVIMLTARTEEQDELFGFDLGVDEYIAKPFSPKILVARVKALLNRTREKIHHKEEYGGIVIDEDGRTVSVDGKPVEMSLREYELLKYLVVKLIMISLLKSIQEMKIISIILYQYTIQMIILMLL